MKIIKNEKEIDKNFYSQYGVILEASASELTQGMRGRSFESWFCQP